MTETPVNRKPLKGTGAVRPVRFSIAENEEIARAAARRGVPFSTFIRRSAVQRARSENTRAVKRAA